MKVNFASALLGMLLAAWGATAASAQEFAPVYAPGGVPVMAAPFGMQGFAVPQPMFVAPPMMAPPVVAPQPVYYPGTAQATTVFVPVSNSFGGEPRPLPVVDRLVSPVSMLADSAPPSAAPAAAPVHEATCGVGDPACGANAPMISDDCCVSRRCWFGGVEATYLVPNLRAAPGVSTSITDLALAQQVAAFSSDTTSSLNDHLFASPRLWIGVQGECWGVVGRYWYLSDGAVESDPWATDGLGFDANNFLRAYTFDLEATRSIRSWRGFDMSIAIGIRHARFENQSDLTSLGTVLPVTVLADALASTQFEGTGPTLAISGTRPVNCDSDWNWFWSARSSYVFGTSKALARAYTFASDGIDTNNSLNEAFATTDQAELFIGEMQIGLQWEQRLECAPMCAFFRVAGEYQYWDMVNAANATSTSTSFVALGPPLSGLSTTANAATGLDPRMSLFGLSVGAGFKY